MLPGDPSPAWRSTCCKNPGSGRAIRPHLGEHHSTWRHRQPTNQTHATVWKRKETQWMQRRRRSSGCNITYQLLSPLSCLRLPSGINNSHFIHFKRVWAHVTGRCEWLTAVKCLHKFLLTSLPHGDSQRHIKTWRQEFERVLYSILVLPVWVRWVGHSFHWGLDPTGGTIWLFWMKDIRCMRLCFLPPVEKVIRSQIHTLY